MFFLTLFQKSGTKTTKKQFCGGRACLASLRTNTGTLQASSSKRQPPGGINTSLKVLHFTLLCLGILDLSVQAPEVFWEFRVKRFVPIPYVDTWELELNILVDLQCGALFHGDLVSILRAGETYLVLSKLSCVQVKTSYR